MGVYGLTTVVANCGKHGASLRTAIQASGRSALLFDGASFLYHVCTCNAFLEAAELKEQCRRWVEGLRACGAEPIFFFDGVHSANKMRTLRQRREEDAKLVAHLYATAVSQHVNKKAKEPTGRVLPLLAKEVVLACLRELNVEVHQSVGEADGLIAAHFRRNREHVFGVVSGDSDFLIFDVRLLPLNKLIWTGEDWRFDAFGNVETARSIGLKSTDLLGIFSCLVGNDYTREELERFPNFRDLLTLKTGASGQKSSFIRNVAVFCNQFLEGKSEDEQVQLVEQHLLIHCRNKDAIVTAIHASLRIIHGNTSEDEALEESMWSGLPRGFRDAFERGQVDNSLLAVLWKRDFWARLSFCSAELEINPVVRPLRLRLFGFLLGRSNVAVTEYFQQGVNFVFEKVMSEYRDGKTNYFERIWSGEKPELTRDQSLKVVLRKIVLPSDAEAVSAIVALPDELRLAVATLRYLMQRSHESEEEPFLFVWEPMVVLLHLLCRHFGVADIFANQPSAAQSFSSKKVRALLLKVPVSRTITVASAFQSVFLHVVLSMQAGNVLHSGVDVFDAAQFNRIYHQFYSFVLLSRNDCAGQQWELRTPPNVLAEQFVEKALAGRPDIWSMFQSLHSQLFSFREFDRFLAHFPDEFKSKQKKSAKKHQPSHVVATSNNPFACLQHLAE